MNGINQIKSPCIGVCEYEKVADRDTERTCKGCSRTAEEIEEWFLASEERRKEIIINCEKRKQHKELEKEIEVTKRIVKNLNSR